MHPESSFLPSGPRPPRRPPPRFSPGRPPKSAAGHLYPAHPIGVICVEDRPRLSFVHHGQPTSPLDIQVPTSLGQPIELLYLFLPCPLRFPMRPRTASYSWNVSAWPPSLRTGGSFSYCYLLDWLPYRGVIQESFSLRIFPPLSSRRPRHHPSAA